MRFIHYFEAYFKRTIVKSPQIKIIKKIEIKTIPGQKIKPFFQIYRVNGFENIKLYDNRYTSRESNQVKHYDRDKDAKIDLPIHGKPVLLYGNIMIVFKDSKMTGNSEIFRLSFNTAFIGQDNMIEIDRW